ncbi:MAG: hypothetical protein GY696_24440 [Gammaproteobacteria bacterium]|nr:hypothetical protein [Gammaproteobacteria bacterium]
MHVGRLKKFTIDNTRRFMPQGLRTDPDGELEELILPPDPEIGEHLPPPERVNGAPRQMVERRFVEPPRGLPSHGWGANEQTCQDQTTA